MARFHLLFRCIGEAVANQGIKCLLGLVPFGERLLEIAQDAQERYRQHCEADEALAQVEAVAQAPFSEVEAEARQVFQEIQAAATPELAAQLADPAVEKGLVGYLEQVPAAVRGSLRRPADPSGLTVPAGRALKRPEDLMSFLPADLPRFRPGDRPLAADWELVELLGKGGFGEVWKARHIHQSRKKPVALKFCLDPVAAATLRNEAALHDLLDRVREEVAAPGIVPLLETYLRNDPPCLMYELIEGGSLAGLVQEMKGQGSLTPEAANQMIHRLASIVAVAHRLNPPLVHRDLKMSNVLVRRGEDGPPDLFVADFGIGGLAAGQALREQAGRRTVSSQLLPTAIRGSYTPLYASPQQAEGEKPDPRDDVHALGVIWYQLVTGDLKMLWIPSDWREAVEEKGLREDHVRLLASCIASRAERRPASAAELVQRLAGLSRTAPASPGQKPSPAGGRPAARQQEEQAPSGELGQQRAVEKAEKGPPGVTTRRGQKTRAQREAEEKLARLVREALERTGGRPAPADHEAAEALMKQANLLPDWASSVIAEAQQQWRKAARDASSAEGDSSTWASLLVPWRRRAPSKRPAAVLDGRFPLPGCGGVRMKFPWSLGNPGGITEAVGAEYLAPLKNALTFDQVGLKEPGSGRLLLDGVSLEIKAGQRVGLVGRDEVEKHALVHLILRLLDPTFGEVRIDGHNLRHVTLESLRAQIGHVLTDNLVFPDTVSNNISCRDRAFAIAGVMEAAKVAHANHFIMKLPGGYQTRVGEEEDQLTPSEQLRIALARAILVDPALLIIEELEGDLNEEAKELLDDTLLRVLPGRTVIFLPHRPSTLRSCDAIFLLDRGKIAAVGTHKDLLARNDLYRHLHYLEFNEIDRRRG